MGSCSGFECLTLKDGKQRRLQPTSVCPRESPRETSGIKKTRFLMGRRKIKPKKKKLDFSLHIYNIQIFNTLFQRWLQSTGLERW